MEKKTGEGRIGRGFFSFLKGRRRLWLLLGGGVLGILLLLLGAAGGTQKSEVESTEPLGSRVSELAAYQASLEKEIERLCEAVAGVSDCTVKVTLSRGYTVSYTEDGDKNPVTVGSGSSEQALFESLSPPVVAGVGVVCRGGQNPTTEQLLVELVSTALGISSARVCVTGK